MSHCNCDPSTVCATISTCIALTPESLMIHRYTAATGSRLSSSSSALVESARFSRQGISHLVDVLHLWILYGLLKSLDHEDLINYSNTINVSVHEPQLYWILVEQIWACTKVEASKYRTVSCNPRRTITKLNLNIKKHTKKEKPVWVSENRVTRFHRISRKGHSEQHDSEFENCLS